MARGRFESTSEIPIPADPFGRIIGQDEAVAIAKIIPVQRRHLLLVGPPGTGKSMIAQAIASVLPKPAFEVSVLDNPENPERPFVEMRHAASAPPAGSAERRIGTPARPEDIPTFVAERLGLRCRRCGLTSPGTETACRQCGADKPPRSFTSEIGQALGTAPAQPGPMRVATTRKMPDGRQETVIYERAPDGGIFVLTQSEMRKLEEQNKKSRRRVIMALTRSLFVQASGASETELLGDVRHDPYGSHPQLGTPPYMRVVPGAVHEAHEGVLFVDELSTMGGIQRHLLTAMQDKAFPILGRNPTSSGASVRVDGVPCDFIFVGATNIIDLDRIVPALRSRVRGDGYEVLMSAHMPDTPENREKALQFLAQEIVKDGRIPHATFAAAEEFLSEARNIAKAIDGVSNCYTLRLRNLSGIIKMAGDLAVLGKHGLIEKEDMALAVRKSGSVEDQLREKYGTPWKAGAADHGMSQPRAGPETA